MPLGYHGGVYVHDHLTEHFRHFECRDVARLRVDTMGGGQRLVVCAEDGGWENPAAPPWVLPAFLAGEPIGPILDCLIESNPDWGWLADAVARVAPHLGACDTSRRGCR
jgi:hypothetical protein